MYGYAWSRFRNLSTPGTANGYRAPLTVAELKEHPEYPHVVWDLPPKRKRNVAVAVRGRGGPINISYEIHGSGPKQLVVNNLRSYL